MDADQVLRANLTREAERSLCALFPLLLSARSKPKVIPKSPEAYAAIKEDVRRARMYSEQAKFLGKYFLDTKDDLIQHALKVRAQMDVLYKERQKLRNKMRWMKDPDEMQPIREQIFAISDKLNPLRKEYAMCKDI